MTISIFKDLIHSFTIHNAKTRFVHLFIINCLFFAFFAWLLPIRFETNDDVEMLLLVSGKSLGIPDAHLVYINYFLGFILKTLYTICNKIEWYSNFLALINIISLTIIIYNICKNEKPFLIKCCFVILFYCLEIRLIISFQFTTISAICALSGLILIAQNKIGQKITGITFFVIASLIRFDASFLVLIIFLPFYLFDFINKNITRFLKLIPFVSLAIIIAVFFRFFDTQKYNSTNVWKQYKQYDLLGHNIRDNPNAYDLIDKLPSTVSYDEFYLYMKFLINAETFTLPIMLQLNERIKTVSLYNKMKHITPTIHAYSHHLFFLALTCLLAIFTAKKNDKSIILILSSLFFFLIFIFISLDGQVKVRVFISAILPLIYIIYNSIFISKGKILKYLIYLSLVGFFIDFSISTFFIWERNIQEKIKFSEQKKLIDSYLKDSSNRVLPFYDQLAIENIDPFNLSKQMHFHQIINSGWMTNHPQNKKTFPSFKTFADGLALFISKRDTAIITKITSRLLANYSISVHPKVVKQTKHYMIVRFFR